MRTKLRCCWPLVAVFGFASVAVASTITFGGTITQSTQDGTGPAVNNSALNNIQDLQAYFVTLVFPGSITTPGIYNLTGGLTFSAIAAGVWHSCGIAAGGAAYCWGTNIYGELGDTTSLSDTPIPVSGGRTFSTIAAGAFESCGLTASRSPQVDFDSFAPIFIPESGSLTQFAPRSVDLKIAPDPWLASAYLPQAT